jgi:hypothetical protein
MPRPYPQAPGRWSPAECWIELSPAKDWQPSSDQSGSALSGVSSDVQGSSAYQGGAVPCEMYSDAAGYQLVAAGSAATSGHAESRGVQSR